MINAPFLMFRANLRLLDLSASLRRLKTFGVSLAALIGFAMALDAQSATTPTLLELAKQRFTNLTPAEIRLFQEAQKGEPIDPLPGPDDYVDNASKWGKDRAVYAERLAWLCINPQASALVTCHGLTLAGLRIDGNLNLENADIKFPLYAKNCAFTGSIVLRDAQTRSIGLSACYLRDFQAARLKVAGALMLDGTCKTEGDGQMDLEGAVIDGDLNLDRAELLGFHNSDPTMALLKGDGVKVGGYLFMRGFRALGEVRLLGATIGRNFECDGATLSNPMGAALNAKSANISGSVFLRHSFNAEGEVSFLGAYIEGNLECYDKARFSEPIPNPNASPSPGPRASALNANIAKIDGRVYLRNKFAANGFVSFVRTTFGRGLQIQDIVDDNKTMTLDLHLSTAAELQNENSKLSGKGRLLLNGFTYTRVVPDDADVQLSWIRLQKEDPFLPQPYEQLAAVLRDAGNESGAKEVMVQKNLDHGASVSRSYEGKGCLEQLERFYSREWWWYNVVGKWIGYGYRPGRAFLASVAFIIVGWLLFRLGYRSGVIQPADDKAYCKSPEGTYILANRLRTVVETYPKFHSFVYSIESFVPLIRFDQAANWAPNANCGAPLKLWGRQITTTGGLLRAYLYFHITAGWVLTTLWVGAVSGLVKS